VSGIKNNLDLAFDLIVLISLLIAAISGFKLGFLQSLFKSIGYIAGGVIGVFIAANYLSNLDSILFKVLSSVVIILLSAVISQYILGRIGLLIHKGLLFAPFKSIDLLAGSLLSVIKTSIIYYIISTLVLATSWQIADDYIKDSKFYTTCDKYLPKVITDIKIEAKRLMNL
jgi:uncharacterized membrane protein required for colicin V production